MRYSPVIGQVVGMYINGDYIENGIVNTGRMHPVMRGGYDQYFHVGEDQMFRMTRPPGGGNFNEGRKP